MAKKKKGKVKGRQRIYGFEFKTPSGYKQAIYEQDCDTRKDFLRERASFKKAGVKIKDFKTRRPYGQGRK